MMKPTENYFIKTYEKALSIDEEVSYIFDFRMDSNDIESFSLYNSMCSEVFIQDSDFVFYKHLLDEKYASKAEFKKINFALKEEEHTDLLGSFMLNEILFLHYKNEIKIINLNTAMTAIVHRSVEHIAIAKNALYVYEKGLQQVDEYFFDATKGESIEFDGLFVAMDYSDGLYILTLDDGKYHVVHENNELSSQYLEMITSENTEITHFAMLENNDFIVCIASKELYYIDNTHNIKELFFDKEIKAIQTDCQGRVWILSQKQLFRFKRDIRYKTPRSFFVKFNSFKENTLWHSIVIDADIPEGTRMEVLVDCDNRPTKRHMNTKKFEKSTQHYINEKDILLYEPKGKKLLLKVTLYSDSTQQTTPKIYAIKSIFDKTSYLEYLPAYYKEDSEELYRFLAIFQNIMDEIDNTIDDMPKKLDVRTTDNEFLSWLSQWLGLVRDHRWPEQKWREFLLRAPSLYKKAGTKEGLSELIELYSSYTPEIEEFSENATHPFFFCVRVDADLSETEVAVITAIVHMFKPAYTEAKVVVKHNTKDNKNLVLGESVLAFSSEIQ